MNIFGSSTSATAIMAQVASSTSQQIVSFSAFFEVMGGILIAAALVAFLVNLFTHRRGADGLSVDDTLMDM